MPFRTTAAALISMLCASAASAEVRLSVREGKKVIYNVGASSGQSRAGGTDFDWLARQRDRQTSFDAAIDRHARQFGVDPRLVKAVITVESNYNPAAVSSKGARGLMQLMPGTAQRFNVADVHDPEENIRGGVAYLAILQRLFNHDLTRVLAAYNAGEGAVLRHGGIPPYAETQMYVRKALTVYHGRPWGGGGMHLVPRGGSAGRLEGGFMLTAQPSAIPPRKSASSQASAGR
jgi:soluble lytic murein transglycosylase-like protein